MLSLWKLRSDFYRSELIIAGDVPFKFEIVQCFGLWCYYLYEFFLRKVFYAYWNLKFSLYFISGMWLVFFFIKVVYLKRRSLDLLILCLKP
jgi:hypothetical protein